jgi:hypothetical protein
VQLGTKVADVLPAGVQDTLKIPIDGQVQETGTLVYLFDSLPTGSPSFVSTIVWRKIARSSPPSFKQMVILDLSESCDPQLSSDGRYLLFKSQIGSGWESPDSVSGFFAFDLQTKRMGVVLHQELSYSLEVPWSPDGRWFAFLEGRDPTGRSGRSEATWPTYAIRTFDMKQKLNHYVKTVSFKPDMCWTSHDTLLFNDVIPARFRTDASIPQSRSTHTGVFEASTVGAPVFLFEGKGPLAASPDNRWIAYMGWIQPEPAPGAANQNTPDAATPSGPPEAESPTIYVADNGYRSEYLCIYDRIKKRHHVCPELSNIDHLIWTPDSKHVLAITGREVNSIEVPSGQVRAILPPGSPEPPDPDGLNTAGVTYQPCGISEDGKTLFVKFSTHGPEERFNQIMKSFRFDFVRSIDLESGAETLIAKTKGTNGIDWLPAKSKDVTLPANHTAAPVSQGGPQKPPLVEHEK